MRLYWGWQHPGLLRHQNNTNDRWHLLGIRKAADDSCADDEETDGKQRQDGSEREEDDVAEEPAHGPQHGQACAATSSHVHDQGILNKIR
jgi:hypothetical protein